MAGVEDSHVLLTNVLRCCARVRITVNVRSHCVSFVKVSFISSDDSLTCVLLEKGGAMQCCGNRLTELDTQ